VSAIIAGAGVHVAPWLVRNFAAYGKPSISSGSAHVLAIGNHECLAREPIRQVYWADPLTMGDALAELLADITEAARMIGTLLQTATGRP
jgi:hypothetical protein